MLRARRQGLHGEAMKQAAILAACCVLGLVLGVLMHSCGLAPW